MATVIAVRHIDYYLLIPSEDLRCFALESSEEFLGEIELETFDPAVASSIDLQIDNCRFAMVSKEQFFA